MANAQGILGGSAHIRDIIILCHQDIIALFNKCFMMPAGRSA